MKVFQRKLLGLRVFNDNLWLHSCTLCVSACTFAASLDAEREWARLRGRSVVSIATLTDFFLVSRREGPAVVGGAYFCCQREWRSDKHGDREHTKVRWGKELSSSYLYQGFKTFLRTEHVFKKTMIQYHIQQLVCCWSGFRMDICRHLLDKYMNYNNSQSMAHCEYSENFKDVHLPIMKKATLFI